MKRVAELGWNECGPDGRGLAMGQKTLRMLEFVLLSCLRQTALHRTLVDWLTLGVCCGVVVSA